jgi:predicted phage terminase large subunit-like protein
MTRLSETALVASYNHLLSYVRYQFPGYKIGKHHRQIADALMAVERGEIKRLVIQAPARHGKSLLTSEYFPAWFLGRNPDKYIMTATYGQELADDFGRKVRNQMRSEEHREVFPKCKLSEDSQSASRFSTDSGGSYFALGVGGAATGRGAHLLVIDDPIKGREEADSDTYRKRLRDWYLSVAYTRLMPGGAIIIMNTRWHEEDLTGWVLTEHTHENWTVIDLPALDDKGNALWPEQYDEVALARIKQTIGQREWQALYMQRPAPDTGDYFKRDWFKSYDKAPKHLRIYGASDYAVTADGGDFTEHGVIGIDPEGEVYLLDWWSGQTTSDVWIETQLDLIDKWKPQCWIGESGPIRRSVEPFLIRRMKERRSLCRLEWLPSIHDKPTRCRPFQAMAASGMVYLPTKEDWAQRLLRQLLTFPVGVFDDAVDVLSLLGRFLDQMRDARVPAAQPIKPKVGTFAHLLEMTDERKEPSKYRSLR